MNPSRNRSLSPERLAAFVVGLALTACSGGQTGQGDPPYDCKERKNPIAVNGRSALGFSAEELIQQAGRPLSGTVRFHLLGVTDTLTLSMTHASIVLAVIVEDRGIGFGVGPSIYLPISNTLEVGGVEPTGAEFSASSWMISASGYFAP